MVELNIRLDESGRVRVLITPPGTADDLCLELLEIARTGIKTEADKRGGVLVVVGPGEDLLALAQRH